MIENNEIVKKLTKRFYKSFYTNAIIGFSIVVLVSIILIMGLLQYLKGLESFWIVIMCALILILMLVVTIIVLTPFLKDMKAIKLRNLKEIIGTVVKYRKVVHGGDPTTYSYYPTIRDINEELIEVEIKADDTELSKIYHCVYLPNTKLAICEKLQDLNESI